MFSLTSSEYWFVIQIWTAMFFVKNLGLTVDLILIQQSPDPDPDSEKMPGSGFRESGSETLDKSLRRNKRYHRLI